MEFFCACDQCPSWISRSTATKKNRIETQKRRKTKKVTTVVNKCSFIGCFANYEIHDRDTVFPLPDDVEQRAKCIKFLNGKDYSSLKHVFICYKHLIKEVFLNTPELVKLNAALKPVPTIFPPSYKVQNLPPPPVLESITNARKSPKMTICQEDELEKFRKHDIIENIADIASKGPKY